MFNRGQTPLCPCGSGLLYDVCCGPFHRGAKPESALALMRSRYSAYAKQLALYVIETTHPNNPGAMADHGAWLQEILAFAQSTRFERLEILEYREEPTVAWVKFKAYLRQGGSDVSFVELSRFERRRGVWLYREGRIVF